MAVGLSGQGVYGSEGVEEMEGQEGKATSEEGSVRGGGKVAKRLVVEQKLER